MEKIIFENAPSTNTPINASNLNQIQDNVENAIDEVEEKLNEKKLNEYIVNYKFENSTTNSVDFNVDIQPNEKVEIEIFGGTNSDGDVNLIINDITTGYYQSGVIYNGTNGASQGTLTQSSGYRPNMAAFYYAHSLKKNVTNIKGVLSLNEDVDSLGNYRPIYSWNTSCSMYGTQLLSFCYGFNATNVTSIKKITIKMGSASSYFKAGTTIKIKKINN